MSGSVWVVTEGNYSDYHIVGIFSSLELATECRNRHHRDYLDMRVEKMPIDPWSEELRSGLAFFEVEFRQKLDKYPDNWKKIDKENFEARPEVSVCTSDPVETVRGHIRTCQWSDCGTPYVTIFVWARDADSAVKAAAEIRTQWIVQGSKETEWCGSPPEAGEIVVGER